MVYVSLLQYIQGAAFTFALWLPLEKGNIVSTVLASSRHCLPLSSQDRKIDQLVLVDHTHDHTKHWPRFPHDVFNQSCKITLTMILMHSNHN